MEETIEIAGLPDSTENKTSRILMIRLLFVFSILALIALAFTLRHNIQPVLTRSPVELLTKTADSNNYLRILEEAIDTYPAMPQSIDYYSNYPTGLERGSSVVWPYLLALVSVPISSVFGISALRATGLLMLLLGILAAVPISLLGKELYGKRVGLFAGIFALFLPLIVMLASVGLDHHVMDIILVAATFALFLGARRSYLSGSYIWCFAFALPAGILTAFAALISVNVLLVISMTLIPVLIGVFILPKSETQSSAAALSIQFGVAALLLYWAASTNGWIMPGFSGSVLTIGHIYVLAAGAILHAVLYLITRLTTGEWKAAAIIGASLVLALALLLLRPQVAQSLLTIMFAETVAKFPLWQESIENISFFSEGLRGPARYFTYFIALVPIVVLIQLFRDAFRRQLGFNDLFTVSIMLMLAIYSALSIYYATFLAIIVAILLALGVNLVLEKVPKSAYPHVPGAIAASILITAMAANTVSLTPSPQNGNLIDTASYLLANAPKSGEFNNPKSKPTYGVMCMWDQSFPLQYLSKQATISSGDTDFGETGILESERFYQSKTEAEAIQIAQQNQVRYVVGHSRFNIWNGDIEHILKPALGNDDQIEKLTMSLLDRSELSRLIGARMYFDVMDAGTRPAEYPLHRFRLIHVSDQDKANPALVLYEFVTGARITLFDKAGTPMTVTTMLALNNDERIRWSFTGRADKDGSLTVTVPYAAGLNGSVEASPYEVWIGHTRQLVTVTAYDVLYGSTIKVSRYKMYRNEPAKTTEYVQF